MRYFLLFLSIFFNTVLTAQDLNPLYLGDDYDLNNSYLFESAKSWFDKADDQWTINFEVINGDTGFRIFDWTETGGYSAPIKVLSESEFEFNVDWKDDNGKQRSCRYKGNLSTNYLKKTIYFTDQDNCFNEDDWKPLNGMTGTDAWPGFVPSNYSWKEGRIISTDAVGFDFNEPVLYFDLETPEGDTIEASIFYSQELGELSDYSHEYFLHKYVEVVCYISEYETDYDRDKYCDGRKLIFIEE